MTYTPEQQKIVDEAMGGTAASQLSPEAQYYRSYGSFQPTQPTVDTSQPSPETAQIQPPTGLTKVPTQGVGPGGEQIFDVFSGQEHIADPNDPRLKGVNIPNLPAGQAPTGFQSKFQKGFQDATAAGIKDVSGAKANAVVEQYAPSKRNDLSTLFLQQDEFFNNLVGQFQQFISPENQRISLKENYQSLLKESGLEEIDLELVDLKAIIEGTEDSIREQITSAGGVANEGQILALASARNKSLIANYNRLLDTRNAKSKYLDTLIGLEQADRQAASQRFEQSFQMGLQIANMGQQMRTNAIASADRIINTLGWQGLIESMTPYEIGLFEKGYGLPTGGAAQAAQQEREVLARTEQERQLGLKEKQLGITGKELDIALKRKQLAELPLGQPGGVGEPGIIPSLTGKPRSDIQNTALGYAQRMSDANNVINEIGGQFTGIRSYISGNRFFPNILKSDDRQRFEQAERNFINAVLRKESGAAISPSEFDSTAKQYFPQPGDSQAVMIQKTANRKRAIDVLARSSNTDPSLINAEQGGSYSDYLNSIK